ncbi:hypothetical protein BRD56_07925 [Thermoplasmatales archaeon SW_10_69_26]|nr:MAG: hypothetical protein BRD56_07925 [Thermoplasmatales archaeon SW_10_69_26]
MAEDGNADADEATGSGQGFNWWLVAIPVVAVATIVIVLLFGARILDPSSIHESLTVGQIAIGGLVVLVILLVVEVVLLMGGHPDHLEDEEEPAPGPDQPAAREDLPEHDTEPIGAEGDFEALTTEDRLEGRDVLEVARPPKDEIDAGVYATTYVEVNNGHVLRLEEMVARRR